MFKSDKSIYLQETEIKPNKYVAMVLAVTVVSLVFCWILNEFGLFRVGKNEMRIGCAIPLVMVAIPLVGIRINKNLLADSGTKFTLIVAAIFVTASVTTLLTFHSTIMLLYPMFIAMLYRSKKVGVVAVCGSAFCTAFTPVLGYMFGAWDIELFRELILIGTNGVAEIVGADPGFRWLSVGKILFYLVLPRLLMVASFALLMFYVIHLGSEHVENQVTINRANQRDALTGLYNRNFFREFEQTEKPNCPVGVIFFDVNGLKDLNDRCGHEYGDILLQRCAKSISDVCTNDDENGFRLGGDEFILLMENATEKDVLLKIEEWKKTLKAINEENRDHYHGLVCSMAYGYSLGEMENLDSIVNRADFLMYRNKEAFKSGKKD